MIGAARASLQSDVAVVEDYTLFLTPSSLFIVSNNGSATSPLISSTVTGSQGALTYQWTSSNSDISALNPAEPSTRFSCSGYNEEKTAVVTCTVADAGAGGAETSDGATIDFVFGVQP